MPALIETAYVEAVKLLNRFVDPAAASQVAELVQGWKPQPDDWERVFMPEAAEKARIAYKPLWVSPPHVCRCNCGIAGEAFPRVLSSRLCFR